MEQRVAGGQRRKRWQAGAIAHGVCRYMCVMYPARKHGVHVCRGDPQAPMYLSIAGFPTDRVGAAFMTHCNPALLAPS